MAYETKDINGILDTLNQVNRNRIPSPQDIRNRVNPTPKSQEKPQTPNEVVNESTGVSTFYNNKLKHIVGDAFELHAVTVDEQDGIIDLEFTHTVDNKAYSVRFNGGEDDFEVEVAAADGNYSPISSSDIPAELNDAIWNELGNLSQYFEDPDKRVSIPVSEDEEKPISPEEEIHKLKETVQEFIDTFNSIQWDTVESQYLADNLEDKVLQATYLAKVIASKNEN